MRRIASLVILCLVAAWGVARTAPVSAQSGTGTGVDLMDVDIMFIGAHPDDDTGVLATLARYLLDEGYKGTVITLTGGEGGGNAIGRESGPSLGLIRQEEERRSLNMVGVMAPQFIGLQDFYFTLSAEEVQKHWGDTWLCDVVRRVRLERPEVILTMWPGPGTHGEHQMAARAATIAYEKAGDPTYCGDQITREFLQPFSPGKLYYYPNDPKGAGIVSIPTGEMSRTAARTYADIRAIAASSYRSQGFDRGTRLPADARPEVFLLVRSRVPVSEPETHLLEGALRPAGTSPAGVRLEAVAASSDAAIGADTNVEVRFANQTAATMSKVRLGLRVPDGWTASAQGETAFAALEPGKAAAAKFTLRPGAGVAVGVQGKVQAEYEATWSGRAVSGRNPTWLRPVAPVQVAFRPTFDIAGYRDFAKETKTEWVIPSLPTRLPLVVGRTGKVKVSVSNRLAEAARGEVTLVSPSGIVAKPAPVQAPGGGAVEATLDVEVGSAALPAGRHSARIPVTVKATTGTATSEDAAEVYVLPSLTAPRVAVAPKIDGDLSDMLSLAHGEIGPNDVWWRRPAKDAADLSADFYIGYDAKYLYLGAHVRDEMVVCNIAPDDVKAQLRSDAIGVTVDPSGGSRDTSTTLQAAAFPCTTAGFGARGFRDADARQGLMEETAPGMQVASKRTAEGYDIEFAIPWSAMPKQPAAGDEIGLNVVLYDGDEKDARVGANISETGLAWAAFEWGGKQALPYLWPRVVLGR
ncbi:MAG: PIG-L family deacetylase [Vicinamibacteria bacterium]|nr:PIG-L family deacetylase [Vicinamibacteria bacterium]